jgi:hypothetical protein
VPEEQAKAAWWEIYAAEGSDWFWWYGPDFTIDTDYLFDELFRLHLQNVYRILGIDPPAHLDVAICVAGTDIGYTKPSCLIEPKVTRPTENFFDWLGAGDLDLTRQATAMFQGDRIGRKLHFGFGAEAFHLRLDLSRQPEEIALRFLLPRSMRLTLKPVGEQLHALFETSLDGVTFTETPSEGVAAHWGQSVLLSVPRPLLEIKPGNEFAFFVQIFEGGLQRERYPERGAIEMTAPGADFEAEHWFV